MKHEFLRRLEKFEKHILKDPKMKGCAYYGSLSRGNFDKYSDYDIALFADEKNIKQVRKNWRFYASLIGKIKFGFSRTAEDVKAFVGDEYRFVDFEILSTKNLVPDQRYIGCKIIKDSNNFLKKLILKSNKLKTQGILISKKDIKILLLSLIECNFYAARHCARGQGYSPMYEANGISNHLFKLLAQIKGVHDYELIRKAETALSKKEKDLLNASTCHYPEQEEIKRAMKANWKFMKYLQNLYETKTHQKLNLSVNEAELLNVITKIYSKKQ